MIFDKMRFNNRQYRKKIRKHKITIDRQRK